MTSLDWMQRAFYAIAQNGKPYTIATDNPKALQNAIHKTLKRYDWKGYRISTNDDSVTVSRKVVE